MASDAITQKFIDDFYAENGKCCAGCDYWRWFNSVAGECIKSAPLPSKDIISMMDISSVSLDINAGFPITDRNQYCGDFKDDANKSEINE